MSEGSSQLLVAGLGGTCSISMDHREAWLRRLRTSRIVWHLQILASASPCLTTRRVESLDFLQTASSAQSHSRYPMGWMSVLVVEAI